MAAENGSVVLRIKRKRTEDPLDALLVAQVIKKPHLEKREDSDKENAESKQDNFSSTVERVFKFIGSVPQGDDVKKKDLLAKIHKQSISHENLMKSHIHDQQTIQGRLRQQKKLLNQESRFKVISSHRESESDSSSHSGSSSRSSEEANDDDNASAEAVDDSDLEVQRLLSVYDLIKDDNEESRERKAKREERLARKRQQSDDVNAILCNSVKMIREKLTVSEESKTDQKKAEKEGYVYDFYYPKSKSCLLTLTLFMKHYKKTLEKFMMTKMTPTMKATGAMITLMNMKVCLTRHRREDFTKIMALILMRDIEGMLSTRICQATMTKENRRDAVMVFVKGQQAICHPEKLGAKRNSLLKARITR